MYVLKDESGKIIGKFSDYAGKNIDGAIYVENECPGEFYTLAADNKTWVPDESRRDELILLAKGIINKDTEKALSAGFEFNGIKFPLTGPLYAQNMAAASAYAFRGMTAGRNLYALDGSSSMVTDIAGLITAGDDAATGLSLIGTAQQAALQEETITELMEFINL